MGATETKQASDPNQLSDREKELIRSSWEQVKKNKKVFAVKIFLKLFTQHPSAQDIFEQLRGIPLEELKTHRKMKAHALRVFASLNTLVEQIDEEDVLVEMFSNVARTHHKYEVGKAHYDLLGGVLIELFGEELGAEFTSDTQGAWLKAYGVMETIILNQCSELDKIAAESKEGPLVKG